jgi:hypothetical protein
MGDWNGYGVHTLSMVFRALGSDVRRVTDTGTKDAAHVTLEFADGRHAWVEVSHAANEWDVFPWVFGFRAGDRCVTGTIKDFDGFYANLMRRAVEFFKSGDTPVSTAEMIRTVAVLEAANASRAKGGEWIELAK